MIVGVKAKVTVKIIRGVAYIVRGRPPCGNHVVAEVDEEQRRVGRWRPGGGAADDEEEECNRRDGQQKRDEQEDGRCDVPDVEHGGCG